MGMTPLGLKLKYLGFSVGGLALMILFQNMSRVDSSKWQLTRGSESSLSSTPGPLPVQSLKPKDPQRIDGKYNLQYHIYGKVHHSLPKKYKRRADEITAAIIEESEKHGLDPVFTLAVITAASNFDPNMRAKNGNIGLMQIQPASAKWVADLYEIPWEGKKALLDPVYNIKIGTSFFGHLRFESESLPREYARAYNPTTRELPIPKIRPPNSQPGPELNAHILNKIYARKLMKHYSLLYNSFKTPATKARSRIADIAN